MIWLPFVLGFLDRLGGGGFAFLGSWVPKPLQQGQKLARKVGVPLTIYAVAPGLERLIFTILMGVILSFNRNEIEEAHHVPARRDWEELFLYPFGLAFCIWTLAGWWSVLVVPSWMTGVYLSNIGIKLGSKTWKLGWHWVESFLLCFMLGVSIWLGR